MFQALYAHRGTKADGLPLLSLHWWLTIIVNPVAVLREPKPKPQHAHMETRKSRASLEGKPMPAKAVTSRHFTNLSGDICSSERPSSASPLPLEPAEEVKPAKEDDSQSMELDKKFEDGVDAEVVEDSQKPTEPTVVGDGPDRMDIDNLVPSTTAEAGSDSAQPDPIAIESESSSADSQPPIPVPATNQPRTPFVFTASQRPPGEQDADQLTEVGDKLDAVDLDPMADKDRDDDGFDPDT